jgi:CRISPR-associated endonuclease/helicase Cas3
MFVYDNPAVLWRSARALMSAGCIVTPTNIRELVEAAYDESNTPAGLRKSTYRAEGNEAAARGVAHQNALNFGPHAYDRSAGLWDSDTRTPTRLGEPTIPVRLATCENGRIKPWCADSTNPLRDWPLSEVSIRAGRVSGVVEDAASAGALAGLRARWPEWDRETLVLVLKPMSDTTWRGRVLDKRGFPCDVFYSRETGWSWGSELVSFSTVGDANEINDFQEECSPCVGG